MNRHLLCLETSYDKQLENPSSMLPVLELLEKVHRMRYVHFTCNTLGEFEWNLTRFKTRANFQILYLAGHGSTNEMHLASGKSVNLEMLSNFMGERFAGWTVHLGGCDTINGSNDALRTFMAQTGVSMVTGYSKPVEWMPSAALEMMWFSYLQDETDFLKLWKNFRKTHAGLVQFNGMKAVFNQ